jgi:putative NIF3 family GTP cyclohydrolase 1 type 2
VDATLPVMQKGGRCRCGFAHRASRHVLERAANLDRPVFQKHEASRWKTGSRFTVAHLPLDVHPVLGNNAVHRQGRSVWTPSGGFLDYKGTV